MCIRDSYYTAVGSDDLFCKSQPQSCSFSAFFCSKKLSLIHIFLMAILIIPVIMFICSLGGTTYGFSDEALALYPLVISTLMACGFDVITATATILCGIISGVSGSTINPFSISVAIDSLVQVGTVSYTHLDVYKRQANTFLSIGS